MVHLKIAAVSQGAGLAGHERTEQQRHGQSSQLQSGARAPGSLFCCGSTNECVAMGDCP